MPTHADCTEALHAARVECAHDDPECRRSHGIDAAACPTEVTACYVAGTSEPVRVCLSQPTQHAQTVYGLGMQGMPSRVVS